MLRGMSRILAIIGSYRKHGTVDQAVDAILASAVEKGSVAEKIYLLDCHLEFCTNCRACTQERGPVHALCRQHDDLESILYEIDTADVLVLGAPVNFYNVTALFRRFMERLVGCAYWPWGDHGPTVRFEERPRKAVLVSSAAMPSFLIPISTGAPRALRMTAGLLGARTVASLWIGKAATKEKAELTPKIAERARKIGCKIA
jgi:FMN-dependent NADH-azoreductase